MSGWQKQVTGWHLKNVSMAPDSWSAVLGILTTTCSCPHTPHPWLKPSDTELKEPFPCSSCLSRCLVTAMRDQSKHQHSGTETTDSTHLWSRYHSHPTFKTRKLRLREADRLWKVPQLWNSRGCKAKPGTLLITRPASRYHTDPWL